MVFKKDKLNKLLGITREYCALRNLKDNEEGREYDSDTEKPFNPKLKRKEEKDKAPKVKYATLDIKPIISMEDSFEEAPNPILLDPPFSMLFIAKPGSGKSTTLLNLLKWYKGYFDCIIVISPTIEIDSSWITAMEDGLVDLEQENILDRYDEKEFVKCFKTIKKKNKGIRDYSKKMKVLFVFDDIVGDMPAKKRTVINNFARNHRHYGISHITLSQEYNAVPPVLRKNCYGICFYDSDNGLEREAIIKTNMGKIGRGRFTNMWNDCCRERFSFLFVKPFETDLQKKYYRKFDRAVDYRDYSTKLMIEEKGEIIIEDEGKPKEEQSEGFEETKEENEEHFEEVAEQDIAQPQSDNEIFEIADEDECFEEGNLDDLIKDFMKRTKKQLKELALKNGVELKKKNGRMKIKKELIMDILEVEDLQL